jgi:hypothetical protein
MKLTKEKSLELAKEICKRPDSFCYFGDNKDLFDTWGFTISVHRDSDALGRSNFEVISEDMQKRFPKQVEITECGHWAVGWIKHLTVKMLTKDHKRVTKAGLAILEWLDKLEDYPVADESHWSETEYDELQETFDNFKKDFVKEICDFIGIDDTLNERNFKRLENFASMVHSEDMGYCSLENCWVTEESIKRFLESKYNIKMFIECYHDEKLIKTLNRFGKV